MTRKLEIEANLDRSLANQVKAPRLDRRFDAGVWARIEAEQQRATHPVPERAKARSSARWLFISNVVAVAVAVLLVAIFGLQSFSEVSVSLPTPEISSTASAQVYEAGGVAIGALALVVGLMLTPIGRRLRAELI
jgi:cytochrome c-type biogenesis protein CcmH/NrfG